MNVAIVTLFDNGNYGSELQSFALSQYITTKGHDVTLCHVKAENKYVRLLELVVDNISIKLSTSLDMEKRIYFSDRSYNASKQRSISSELKSYVHQFVVRHIKSKRVSRWHFPNKHFDAYICGSDQIWSALRLPICPQSFLYGISPKRKIAYAPSLGLDEVPEYYIRQTKKYISDFKYLSVREDAAQLTLKSCMGIDALQVLDPTMLVGVDFWNNMLDKENKSTPNNEYVFCYYLGELSKEAIACINQIAGGRDVIILPYEEDCKKVLNGKYQLADPLDFVNLIKNAKYVLTDSFHGSVFSVLYEKQFVVTKRSHVGRVAQASRIMSLISKFGLENQYCQNTQEMLNALKTPIDYSKKSEVYQRELNISREFIDNALLEITNEIKNE